MNSIQGKGKRQKASQNKTVNKSKPKPSKGIGRTILEGVGSTLGGLVGLKDIGRDAGAWISKVTGLGEYKVNSNVFAKSSEDIPVFEYNKDGSIIVTHREMVSDIVGSQNFSSRYWDIHPLNAQLFPWLSIEALGFEQYEFQGLLLCYNATCGDAIASTNNAMGTVVIATEYDVSRPPFMTKSEMESYMFTTAKKPSVSFIHPVECNPRADILNARYNTGYFRTQSSSTYMNPTSFTSNVAENLQCLGRAQVSTVGQQAATTIGELWVTYKVKFTKPRAPPSGLPGGFFHATSGDVGALTSGSTAFGAVPLVYSDSTFQADTVGITSSTITLSGLRPGTKVLTQYTATSTAGSSPTFTPGLVSTVGVIAVQQMYGSAYTLESGVGTSTYCQTQCYQIGDNPYLTPPVLTYANPTIAGSGATFKWDLMVFILPLYNGLTMALTSYEERASALQELYKIWSLHAGDKSRENFIVEEEKYVTPAGVPPVTKSPSRFNLFT
jgi:hypothetical protein